MPVLSGRGPIYSALASKIVPLSYHAGSIKLEAARTIKGNTELRPLPWLQREGLFLRPGSNPWASSGHVTTRCPRNASDPNLVRYQETLD